jgi:colicin import membrane protein
MFVLKNSLLAIVLAMVAQSVMAEEVYADVAAGLVQVYPAGSITSSVKADAALAAVDHFTTLSEARYIELQRVCYDKFFTTHCLDNAKDDHRVTLKAINKVEIEANRYQRQARADEADRSIQERNAARNQNKQ